MSSTVSTTIYAIFCFIQSNSKETSILNFLLVSVSTPADSPLYSHTVQLFSIYKLYKIISFIMYNL